MKKLKLLKLKLLGEIVQQLLIIILYNGVILTQIITQPLLQVILGVLQIIITL